MKKVLSAVTAAVLLSSSAAAAPGDAAGNVYSTDIITYMYNSPITSYNIGGKTCIDAEILNWHYGFDVYWYADTRRLEITDKGGQFTSLQAMSGEITESSAEEPGIVVGNYYETDIVTTLNGREIEAYNIGGRTFICAEAMREFGYNVVWDETNRTLSISKPMDFYKYETDLGTVNSIYKLGREATSVFLRREPIAYKDGKSYLIDMPSDKLYMSPDGPVLIKLADLVSLLGGTCVMEQGTEKYRNEWVNGKVDEWEEYVYTVSLDFDAAEAPALTEYSFDAAEEPEREEITGEVVTLPVDTIVINGEPREIHSFYGGHETVEELIAVDGEIYVSAYILAELFGYDNVM